MAGDKQPPEGKKLGKGTQAQGRLGDGGDVPPHTIPGNKQPPYDVVGVDALSPLLERVEFPATKEDLAERIGDADIPVSKDATLPAREILERVTGEEFRSGAEVEDAVKARWDDIAPRQGRGGRHPERDNTEERPRNNT